MAGSSRTRTNFVTGVSRSRQCLMCYVPKCFVPYASVLCAMHLEVLCALCQCPMCYIFNCYRLCLCPMPPLAHLARCKKLWAEKEPSVKLPGGGKVCHKNTNTHIHMYIRQFKHIGFSTNTNVLTPSSILSDRSVKEPGGAESSFL